MELRFPQFGEIERPDLVTDRIRILANEIRRACGQARRLPFDPRACADFFRIPVSDVCLPCGVYGRTAFGRSGPAIELRAEDRETRKRFTLSHELAHLCFLEDKPVAPDERYKSYFTDVVSQREERLCDSIAAELLMPAESFLRRSRLLEQSADWVKNGAERIEEAVKRLELDYGASAEAVLRRVCDVRAWSVGLGLWSLTSLQRLQFRITVARGVRSSDARHSTRRLIAAALCKVEEKVLSREILLSPWGTPEHPWRQKNGLFIWLRQQRRLNGASLLGVVISSS